MGGGALVGAVTGGAGFVGATAGTTGGAGFVGATAGATGVVVGGFGVETGAAGAVVGALAVGAAGAVANTVSTTGSSPLLKLAMQSHTSM